MQRAHLALVTAAMILAACGTGGSNTTPSSTTPLPPPKNCESGSAYDGDLPMHNPNSGEKTSVCKVAMAIRDGIGGTYDIMVLTGGRIDCKTDKGQSTLTALTKTVGFCNDDTLYVITRAALESATDPVPQFLWMLLAEAMLKDRFSLNGSYCMAGYFMAGRLAANHAADVKTLKGWEGRWQDHEITAAEMGMSLKQADKPFDECAIIE